MRLFSPNFRWGLLACIGWLASGSISLAQTVAPAAAAFPRSVTALAARGTGRSIGQALNPDGTLRPGVNGSFNATGYQLSYGAGGAPVLRPAGVGDENWQAGFGLPGTNSQVYALAVAPNGDVYLGGLFSIAGTVLANNVAKWDGTNWSALSTGITGVVFDLAVSGTNVYVGGQISAAGGVAVNNVARWNGTAWSALGTGLDDVVFTLDVSGADVYVGGPFTQAGGALANHVAHWNGTAWSALGTGITGSVQAIAVSGPDVYVGGTFGQAGTTPAANVARWNGTAWSALGTGINGDVNAVAVAGTDVYVGGTFSQAGTTPAANVARWNGTAWSALGTGVVGTVFTIAVSGPNVYVGGDITQPGAGAQYAARWNGTAWSALGTGIGGPAAAIAISGANVFVSGDFTTAGGAVASYVARWNGTTWAPLGTMIGVNGEVKAVAVFGSNVYVGGTFTAAGGVATTNIARWNGTAWSALGTGINGPVTGLAVAGTTVYAVGTFTQAGGGPVANVARWNGTSWSALGTGVNGSALAVAISGPNVYVGGGFSQAGGVAASYVARWNGTAWAALGAGANDTVRALAATATDVYAGGKFSQAGGAAAGGIARWNGTAWSALGTNFSGQISAVAVAGANVYVGGALTLAGSNVDGVAQWNGTAWTIIGTMSEPFGSPQVNALTILGANLVAGGQFTDVNGLSTANVAQWNGTAWLPLGTGLGADFTTDKVAALAVSGFDVFAGGFFTTVGDGSKVTLNFGIYHAPVLAPTIILLNPSSGLVGASVVISGTNLAGATAVTFNGTSATASITNNTATSLTVTVPVGATTGPVQVTTPAGTATSAISFTVLIPPTAPTGVGLSPQSIPENTASGTAIGNFSTTDPNSSDTFTYTLVNGAGSGNNASFSISGNQLLTAAVFNFETTPSRAIRVRTTDQGGLFFEQAFTITVTNVNETPAIAAQTRTIAENSANNTNVGAALTATDPDAGTTLTYSILSGNTGGAFSFTGNQLRVANVAALDFETTPVFTLTVQVSDGTLTAQNTVTVNLTDVAEGPGAPTITGFTPASGPVGASVTVSGTNLAAATAVTFNGTSATASITANTATSLTVTVPVGATTGLIGVTTAGGSASSTTAFTVTTVTPLGLTFFPGAGSPGSIILVTGTNFTSATIVRFNGAAATGIRFVSATELVATVPGNATTGAVTALTGATTLTGTSFTVTTVPAARITYFTPLRAPVGTTITLFGANFTGVTAVRFGPVSAPGFTVVSATRLTVPVPVGATSDVRLYVVAAGGMAQSARTFTLILPPTLTSAFPGYGSPGSLAVLTGTNLTNATEVTFGGVRATQFTAESATRIVATIPTGALSGPVTATTVAGTASTVPSFIINAGPAPSITSLTPGSGSVGATVVVAGTNLSGATSAKFNQTEAVGFVVNSAAQITASVPGGATTGRVWVLTPGGLTRSATEFRVNGTGGASAPVITSFAPASGSPGALVILTGLRLGGATQVRFGGNVAAAGFTVNSATQLTATVPAGAITGPISVTTPGGSASTPTAFVITTTPAPQVLSFSPASGPAGTLVTVLGSGFIPGATALKITIKDILVSSLTVASATSLSFTVPTAAQTGRIRVFAAGGLQQSATNFVVIPTPTITNLSPVSGSVGSTVLITGANLTGATQVRFGGVNAPIFTVNSATQITGRVPAGALSGTVTVTTAGGTASSPMAFTVTLPPPPTVTGLNPTSGIVGSQVTVTGTNFSGATSVRFTGKAAESFVVTSATTLTVQVPAGATTGPVSVTNAGGMGVSVGLFTVLLPPDIDGLQPAYGPVGTVVTLTGSDFTGATGVFFGATPASAFAVAPDGKQATATVAAGALSGQVSLTTPIATAISAQTFTVTLARPDGVGWVQTEPIQLVPYPNPASTSQRLTVQVLNRPTVLGSQSVYLLDALGRRIREVPLDVELSQAVFDLDGIGAGLYIVRCGPATQQVLIER